MKKRDCVRNGWVLAMGAPPKMPPIHCLLSLPLPFPLREAASDGDFDFTYVRTYHGKDRRMHMLRIDAELCPQIPAYIYTRRLLASTQAFTSLGPQAIPKFRHSEGERSGALEAFDQLSGTAIVFLFSLCTCGNTF